MPQHLDHRTCPHQRHFSHAGLAGILLLSSLASGTAFGQDVIGKAELVENRVTGQQGMVSRPLAATDPVHRDERITTGETSQARLRFRDETDLRLGASASIRLDAFVFSGDRNAAMELSGGAMRFVSGNGPKGSYMIRTPIATVGLRGTIVEVTVAGSRTYVSLHEGAAEVCTRGGRCTGLARACTYVVVDARGITQPRPLRAGLPVFSARCTGAACVVDRCTAAIKGQAAATPPAARPPRAKPPQTRPPHPQRLRRVMLDADDDVIIEEPARPRPLVPGLVPLVPGLIIGPGLPGRPAFPGKLLRGGGQILNLLPLR